MTNETVAEAETNEHGHTTAKAGAVLIMLGVIAVVMGFAFNVGIETHSGGLYGVPETVANTDKIAMRHLIVVTGLASFLSGCIFVSAGNIITALHKRS